MSKAGTAALKKLYPALAATELKALGDAQAALDTIAASIAKAPNQGFAADCCRRHVVSLRNMLPHAFGSRGRKESTEA